MRRSGLIYFFFGVLVGGLAGLIVGVLFAPSSGLQTRRRLADEASRVAETARHAAEQVESMAHVLGAQRDHYLGRDEELAWRKVQEIREGVQKYSRTVMS